MMADSGDYLAWGRIAQGLQLNTGTVMRVYALGGFTFNVTENENDRKPPIRAPAAICAVR